VIGPELKTSAQWDLPRFFFENCCRQATQKFAQMFDEMT
jgi:hypothetical protein